MIGLSHMIGLADIIDATIGAKQFIGLLRRVGEGDNQGGKGLINGDGIAISVPAGGRVSSTGTIISVSP